MDRSITVRDARDDDGPGLIALLGRVFAEYPGCLLEVDGEMPELRAIASYFRAHDGEFRVATREGEIVGCVGWTPASEAGGIELRKLYVAHDLRGTGLGAALCAWVEHTAEARGARFIDLWSDTRFERAHAFYARRGFVRGPDTRALHDLSNTVEYYFRKRVGTGAPDTRH